MSRKIYKCSMCNFELKIDSEEIHIILCPKCISDNKHVEIDIMEPYIKMNLIGTESEK